MSAPSYDELLRAMADPQMSGGLSRPEDQCLACGHWGWQKHEADCLHLRAVRHLPHHTKMADQEERA